MICLIERDHLYVPVILKGTKLVYASEGQTPLFWKIGKNVLLEKSPNINTKIYIRIRSGGTPPSCRTGMKNYIDNSTRGCIPFVLEIPKYAQHIRLPDISLDFLKGSGNPAQVALANVGSFVVDYLEFD